MNGDACALAERLADVRAAIADAARRAGRDAARVRIVAVTKTFPPAVAAAALAAGLSDIGENYVQEAKAKRTHVAGGTWHLIGGLQRNKVRAAVAVFDRVHTVDSPDLASALATAAASAGRRLPVLVQVNVAHEATKRGADPAATGALCEAILRLAPLALDGLMTIGPLAPDPEAMRPCFRALRELRDDLAARLGVELPQLSMGMSDDFAVAVEEGATLVRLGRALFGARQAGAWREG
ncbi:MAG TPA: YggS family pyridoxal phosphate-dependent enzyme [Candidatus Eisenbacteria bacterium]|nr:YggS family pyridoxal phosphate-dependent enzyme [Candidatus Eisenbacteria bacterium]